MSARIRSTCLLALASAAMPFIAGCNDGSASTIPGASSENEAPIPVQVRMVQRQSILATYQATATIDAEGDAPVLARVAGDVIELIVEEGDYIEAGQALARLDGERLKLEMQAAKANLEKARGEYERYTNLHERGLVSKSMYDGLKFELDALAASHDLARLNYEYSVIRAPIAGFVSGRDVKLGQHVDVGQTTFRITNTSELQAHLEIPQSELAKFAAGHSATLAVDSIPGRRFPARIARISPTIDVDTGTFRATAFIDNADGLLAPGMFARFSVAYDRHEEALVIPAKALVAEDEAVSVFVAQDGQVQLRPVATGINGGDLVEITSGLDETDQVVVVGQASLRDGSRVLARLANPAG